jgi:hypothetical protein
MSLEKLRALMRTYVPGRRVRLKDGFAASRRDRVPEGVSEGLILKVVPLPSPGGPVAIDAFGAEVEFEKSPGDFDTVIVPIGELDLAPLSLNELRRDLWRREVNFPRSTGIGIVFPKGAGDYGVIDDAHWRTDPDDGQEDLVVSLRVAVDPAVNPRGLNVFYVDADFIQCVLLMRKPSH